MSARKEQLETRTKGASCVEFQKFKKIQKKIQFDNIH